MNNFRKSIKELFQVNLEAGLLRLFLAAVLTFILWSLLAIISASLDPLGNLDLRNILGFNSRNLAISLFLDIISAYFSTFAILFILLFLLVAFLSLETVADFYTHLKSFPSNGISKNYLSSCAFSFPKRKKILFPDDFIKHSGYSPTGPVGVLIKPGYGLLVSNGANYSVIYNNCDTSENFDVSLSSREMIIDCFNLSPTSFSFKTEDQISTRSFLVEVAYSYNLPVKSENMAKFANMLALCDSTKIRKVIENILISETNLTLSRYLRNSPRPSALPFGQVPEKPVHNTENITKGLEQKKYTLVFNSFKKGQNQVIKRNRKRSIYLLTSPEVTSISINHEENLFPSLKDQLNELLEINLQSTFITLFGTDSIKAKIINIHEQG